MRVHRDDIGDYVCEHGTAVDVHCCNCHNGFIFDLGHECEPASEPQGGLRVDDKTSAPQSDGYAPSPSLASSSGVSPEARQTLQQKIDGWRRSAAVLRASNAETTAGCQDPSDPTLRIGLVLAHSLETCATSVESWLTPLPPASPDIFKGHTAVEVLAWDRGWREASRQARESAPLPPASQETETLLRRAVGNCYMMAKREIARHLNQPLNDPKGLERWRHVQRFCETTGEKSSILRGQLPTEITEGSASLPPAAPLEPTE